MIYQGGSYREIAWASELPARDPVRDKLKSFGALPQGWDSGQGKPVSTGTRDQAEKLVSLGENLGLRTDVFPGANDEVAVTYYRGDDCVEAIVDNTGRVEIYVEEGRGFSSNLVHHVEDVELRDVFELLINWGRLEVWSSHDSLIPDTLISSSAKFATLPSSQLQVTASVLRMESAA